MLAPPQNLATLLPLPGCVPPPFSAGFRTRRPEPRSPTRYGTTTPPSCPLPGHSAPASPLQPPI